MSEKPILFSTSMVQAILEGRKTQTRQVVKPQPDKLFDETRAIHEIINHTKQLCEEGDVLYVREAWEYGCDEINRKGLCVDCGECGGTVGEFMYKASYKDGDDNPNAELLKWHSPMYMPRTAARIFLRVTNVGVDRLQDISPQNARSEGVSIKNWTARGGYDKDDSPHYREAYAELWDSLNAKRGFGWDSNPWVYVISFDLISKQV